VKRLYHCPLNPAGRLVRLGLGREGEAFELFESTPWAAAPDVSALAHSRLPRPGGKQDGGKTFGAARVQSAKQMEELKNGQPACAETANEAAEGPPPLAWVEAVQRKSPTSCWDPRLFMHGCARPPAGVRKLRRGRTPLRGGHLPQWHVETERLPGGAPHCRWPTCRQAAHCRPMTISAECRVGCGARPEETWYARGYQIAPPGFPFRSSVIGVEGHAPRWRIMPTSTSDPRSVHRKPFLQTCGRTIWF